MVGVFVVVFHAQSVKGRDEFGGAVAVRQAACHPFVYFAAEFFGNNAAVNVNHLLHGGSFFHRPCYNAAGNFHLGACNNNFIGQRFNCCVKALLLRNFKAAYVNFAVSVAGDNADFIVGAADYADVNRIGRYELAAVGNAACFQRFGGKIFRFAGHGACQRGLPACAVR